MTETRESGMDVADTSETRSIRRVLVANRGEIAIRVFRACRELGIESVAVYSDADENAPHVAAADTTFHLGGSAASESYLNIERIVAAAIETEADAIHPGYGFLSENPGLADACSKNNVTFIGPPASSMRLAADKSQAKLIADECNVPTVPLYDISAIPADAYPVLVKAIAGGGGRGMRSVYTADELDEAVAAAKREAVSSFGSDELLVEKLIVGGRHVEVQLLADEHGTVLHVGNRDCSLQRRHQKVIEEAPAAGIGFELSEAIGSAAVRIAQACGYVNAGTAEFLVAADGSFYFLELNARLQVEHPATECAYGIDLVHQQLQIASGAPLTLTQDKLRPIAHAIEARVYAEHPVTMLPTGGRLLQVDIPDHPSVRIDHAVQSSSNVSLFYDPLLAKVIATGATREEARVALIAALRKFALPGVIVNTPLLIHALELDEFINDSHTIATLESRPLTEAAIETSEADAVFARALYRDQRRELTPFSTRHDETSASRLQGLSRHGDVLWFCVDGTSHCIAYDHIDRSQTSAAASHSGSAANIASPMPGTVLQICEDGTEVKSGDTVAVVEAMKMENAVTAPFDGTVQNVSCTIGDMVTAGAVLAEVVR